MRIKRLIKIELMIFKQSAKRERERKFVAKLDLENKKRRNKNKKRDLLLLNAPTLPLAICITRCANNNVNELSVQKF